MKSLASALTQLNKIILGKEDVIKQAIACLLADGHLLIEDLPGMGKTTLAHALARVFALDFQRVQFTSDMLPADILGVSIFRQETQAFEFRPGPIFTQVLLADEINRAAPKAQSALLEAMEEKQVTVDGTTHKLAEPFFVIATQNPVEQGGTFPLPESQLDRFLMCVSLGYPSSEAELALLADGGTRDFAISLQPMVDEQALRGLMAQVNTVRASDDLLRYVQRLLQFTRNNNAFVHGLSPRSGLGLLQAAKAWAMLDQRQYVVPEDVQAVLPAVANHRLEIVGRQEYADAADIMLEQVPVLL